MLKSFAAGSFSGTCSTLLFQPFDLLKTRIQNAHFSLVTSGSSSMASPSSTASNARMISIVFDVVKNDHFVGLWRGTGPVSFYSETVFNFYHSYFLVAASLRSWCWFTLLLFGYFPKSFLPWSSSDCHRSSCFWDNLTNVGRKFTHTCDSNEDTIRKWHVCIQKHGRSTSSYIPFRRSPRTDIWPCANFNARCSLFWTIFHVLFPNETMGHPNAIEWYQSEWYTNQGGKSILLVLVFFLHFRLWTERRPYGLACYSANGCCK